ncbi:MAG TPA: aminoglycoside phosphotransferase, partial [Methylibium sp.]
MDGQAAESVPGQSLARALQRGLEQQTGQAVAVKETHISWVLLTGQLAFKLKKPVRLPFLDFGSIAARKHWCEEELRLNRRTAPGLYLSVLPVRGAADAPRIAGKGPVI